MIGCWHTSVEVQSAGLGKAFFSSCNGAIHCRAVVYVGHHEGRHQQIVGVWWLLFVPSWWMGLARYAQRASIMLVVG